MAANEAVHWQIKATLRQSLEECVDFIQNIVIVKHHGFFFLFFFLILMIEQKIYLK
jgi:hypothetical protein